METHCVIVGNDKNTLYHRSLSQMLFCSQSVFFECVLKPPENNCIYILSTHCLVA